MRKKQKEALNQLAMRCDLKMNQMKELSMLLSSTCGPLLIGALIEEGLSHYRKRTVKGKKK
jgi:hypothetical protein